MRIQNFSSSDRLVGSYSSGAIVTCYWSENPGIGFHLGRNSFTSPEAHPNFYIMRKGLFPGGGVKVVGI